MQPIRHEHYTYSRDVLSSVLSVIINNNTDNFKLLMFTTSSEKLFKSSKSPVFFRTEHNSTYIERCCCQAREAVARGDPVGCAVKDEEQ